MTTEESFKRWPEGHDNFLCYKVYNLGKFRITYGKNVYYMLFGFIPIYVTKITGSMDKRKVYKVFHQIARGFEV